MGTLSLVGRITLNASAFEAGLNSVQASAARVGATLTRAFAPALSAAAVTAAARRSIAYASRISDLAKATGISAEDLQEFDHAMHQNGATMEDATKAAKNLAKARAEALADPNSAKAGAFGKLGIGADELSRLSDSGALLKRLSDALKGVNVDANTLPIVLELIGDKSMAVIPALVAGLRDLGAEAREGGLVMKGETVAALDELGDKLDAFGKKVTVGLAPVLTTLLDWVEAFVDKWEAGMSGILTMFGKLQTMNFGGKSPLGILQEVLDAGALGTIEAEGDIAVEKLTKRLAAAKAGRRLDIDPGAANNHAALAELMRLRDFLAGKDDPAFRRKQIGEQMAALDAGAQGGPLTLKDMLTRTKLEAELMRLQAHEHSTRAFEHFSQPSDPYRSVGRYLGTDPNARDSKDILRNIHNVLQKIDSNTRHRMDDGVQFPL
jgi:hypothetical protein